MPPCILIIDDERHLVDMLRDIVRSLGCEAVGTCSLRQGLQVALDCEIDLVLLDNHFPEGHADSILAALIAAKPDLPVVIITGNESDQHVHTAMHMGAREVLGKPFGLQELRGLLERYCGFAESQASQVA